MAILFTEDYLQAHGINYRDQEYKKGTQLITEKEQFENKFYIILAGELDVFVDSGDHRFDIPLTVLKKDDYCGELALLHIGARSASVRVKTATAKLRVISETEFKRLIDAQPQPVLREFIAKLVGQVRRLTTHVRILGLKTVPERLQATLRDFGQPLTTLSASARANWSSQLQTYIEKRAGQTLTSAQQTAMQDCRAALTEQTHQLTWLSVELPHSREQLSRYLRCDRSPVSREIKVLEKAGVLLDLAPKRILITTTAIAT